MTDVAKAIVDVVLGSTAITDLIGQRFYPDVADSTESKTLPYVVFSFDGAEHADAISGATGIVNRDLSVNIYAATSFSRLAVTEAFRNLLDGYKGLSGADALPVRRAHLQDSQSLFVVPSEGDQASGRYRQRMNFEVWHLESVPTLI